MSSTRCKECIVYHYWNHMGDHEKSFLNFVIGGYVAVPKKFANNIKGQIPEFVKLEVPDGKSYDIQIAKEHNELVFRSGWAKFASAYELEQGDRLVFRYSGSSRFRVQIFDKSGCEKEFSCVVMNNTPPVKGSCGHWISTSSQNKICKDCAAHYYWHQMDKRRFFMVMLDEDFESGLIIPKKFVNNVGGQISERIKLKVQDGETYDIEVDKQHNKLLLQSGWAVFASAYELEQGDTLVFAYSGDSHFEVQIFSPSTSEKELSCFPINSIPCVQESIASLDSHLQSSGSERMNKACTPCKDCITNHYWHHMGDSDRCFIKVIMSGSNFKEKLIILKKFVENVGGQIPEEVQLEVPNGKTYNVKVAREQDALVMGSGWANFASAYDLKEVDFLVFTYSGKSHFKVRIFDPSNCEKYFSCVSINSIPCVQESITSRDSHLQSSGSERMNKTCTPCKDCIENHYWHHMGDTARCFIKVIMSNFKEKLIIPKKFAENVGGQIPEEVQLEVPNGKTYNVKVAREKDALVMGSGWANFASAYDLKHGDFLVFSYSGKSHFKVRIFDPSNCEKYFSEQHERISNDNTPTSFHMQSPMRKRSVDHCHVSSSHMRKTSKKKATNSPSQKPGYVPSSRRPMHGVTEDGYMTPRFTVLSDKQERKVKEKVRSIQSPYDIFVLIVRTSNVNKKLSIMVFSTDYAKKYLQGGYDTISLLHPKKTNTWEAGIAIYRNNRHTIGRGWREFASDNELKVGDICLFQLMEMETKKLTMTVHIIRKHECT